MILLALKMLIGKRASFIGIIFGIFLATLLISQQSAIFLGLISRSYRTVTDIPEPNIWVVDPATESDDKLRRMPESYLDIVRSTPGIEWAMPIGLISLPMVTDSGIFQICQLYGIDDATLIGAPSHMIEGNIKEMRREGGVIVDIYSANGILAKTRPDGSKVPLKIGDELAINDHRAVVVGICQITQGFYPQPIIFTTYKNFSYFASSFGNQLGFIIAKTLPGENIQEVRKQINVHPGLDALTSEQFKERIVRSFLKTGILINFGLSVALGMIIGFSIAGQIFYITTVENLMYYALIKALGGNRHTILQMIAVQAVLVGIIGYLLGIGATILWGEATKNTTLAFLFPWQLFLFTGVVVILICLFTAGLSILKVFRIDPKALMGN
ncbi:ABC transporter permease [Candidatus Protochlamydia phocaeensis]|uniref:ABC transporter permease n=1 Tax=Candidatus Protochlamydia phocaeensis TaxID=1414722 RepID=UPI0008387832|nr:ABC transporter permease [Candidatus Protochlamydia phocaeensis]